MVGLVLPQSALTIRPSVAAEAVRAAWQQPPDLWTRDAAWSGSLVDCRQALICGNHATLTAGCNLPYGNHQFWFANAPCSAESMATIMFQTDRYLFAQRLLTLQLEAARGLTLNLADEAACTADGRLIERDPQRWAQWAIETARLLALAQWTSNLRWWMVSAAGAVGSRDTDVLAALRPSPRSALRVADGAVNYDQMGWSPNIKFGWEMARGTGIAGGGGLVITEEEGGRLPPIVELAAPRSYDAFAPTWNFVRDPELRIRPDIPVWPRDYGRWPLGSTLERMTRFCAMASHPADIFARWGDVGVMEGSWRRGLDFPEGNERRWWGTALATLRALREQAAFIVATPIGTAINRALATWAAIYDRTPPELRSLTPGQIVEVARSIAQADLDARAAVVGSAFGAAASAIAALPIPVFAQLAGAIVAIIGVISTAIVRYGRDLGLMPRMANPTFAPPPFVRMIAMTNETAACDYSSGVTGGAVGGDPAQLARIAEIARGSLAGVSPRDWFEAIRANERRAAGQFYTPDPSGGLELAGGFPWGTAALVGAGVAGLGALALALRRR